MLNKNDKLCLILLSQLMKTSVILSINMISRYHDVRFSSSTLTSLIISLYSMLNFTPEGLKAYTRNIYKQRTQVK